MSAHAHDIYDAPHMIGRTIPRALLTVTCTEAARETLLEHVPAAAPGQVIANYHGTRLDLFETAVLASPTGRPCEIVSIGTLVKRKGFDLLIESCAILQRRGLSFHCTIVGDGPEGRALRRLCEQRGLGERITFAGVKLQRQLVEFYARADVLVFAGRRSHSGLPNVIVEALACGVPVVATAMPWLRELILSAERGGMLVEFDDPAQIADAVLKIASKPQWAKALGAAGRDFVRQHFDAVHTGEQLAEILHRVLARALSEQVAAR